MSESNNIRSGLRYSSFRGLEDLSALILLLALALSACSGCSGPKVKRLNKRVTFWRKDKIPYATYVAYESLPHLFPSSDITINRNSPSNMTFGEDKKAYIIISQSVNPSPAEVTAILNFVGAGNHVFISAFAYSDTLLHVLNLEPAVRMTDPQEADSMRLSIYNPVTYDSLSFAYPGASYDTWVRSLDSQYTTVLGRDAQGRPDFVKFNYKGGGSLYLHFAPMAFSNFFLLHKDNIRYYENALSYLPVSVKEVIWDDYFRYDHRSSFSALGYILQNRSLQWGFWLLLLLFGLIYLFESKRRQRIIPVISGLRNTSLDFVRTIGRLYYQRRDNHNLAVKMAAHFQDHVRGRYNLSVSITDDSFTERLSYKTGIAREPLEHLVADIRRLQEENYTMTDWELLDFNRKMEEFYKTA